MLNSASDGVGAIYLIICDSISQFFDEAIQNVGVVNVIDELYNAMLFSKRSKICNNSSQLPVKKTIRSEIYPWFLKGVAQTFSKFLSVSSLRYLGHPQDV